GPDPAEETTEAYIGATQAQLTVDLGELKIVHAYDCGAVRVDDLLVEEVAGGPKGFARRLGVGGRLKAVTKAEVTDLLREIAPAQDLLARRRRDDRPLRGRELPLRHDRDVRELTHLVAVRLDDPAVLYFRQVRHDAGSVTGTIRISQSARPGVPSRVGGRPRATDNRCRSSRARTCRPGHRRRTRGGLATRRGAQPKARRDLAGRPGNAQPRWPGASRARRARRGGSRPRRSVGELAGTDV